jgi:Flp pilus assembly CpaE family ATPase
LQIAGGIGAHGDEHEHHADAVADHVVRGESAEARWIATARREAARSPARRCSASRSTSRRRSAYVTTFYSFKGGVGRTTLLVNVAHVLAAAANAC